MASVKWLERIAPITGAFQGYFQVEDYVIPEKNDEPCQIMDVRAIITFPADGGLVPRQSVTIEGYAWSGAEAIEAVHVSSDGGRTWANAHLEGNSGSFCWRSWQLEWHPHRAGDVLLVSRAVDATGAIQPLENVWNSVGYCNNAAQPVKVQVV